MIVVGIYVLGSVDDLNKGFTVDGDLYKVDSTLITVDKGYTNIPTTDIYKRLDLFNDETISVTSAIQDSNDISKTYTDFSQSFTIPANANNNEIFSHWYENQIDNGYDARIRKSAYITLDTKVFRVGKIQLEKVDLKNDIPQSYSITFFGALVSLKDTFNGLFLKDLDSGTFNFTYNATVVQTKITTLTTDAVKFPLISSNRIWQYGGGGLNDISLATSPINLNELFPAIKLKSILDLIATKFNISFTGTFITSNETFLKAYMFLKNSDIFTFNGGLVKINYQTQTGSTNYMNFDLINDELTLPLIVGNFTNIQRKVTLNLTFTTAGNNYYIYLYKNGINIAVIKDTTIIGTRNIEILNYIGSYGNTTDKYTFKVSATVTTVFTSTATLFSTVTSGGVPATSTSTINQTTSQTTNTILSVEKFFPSMKIEDFFSGILKMFNLVCYSEATGVYVLEQLETYYSKGNTLDITKYLQSDVKAVERIKPYNKVNFEHEKSQIYTNVNFAGTNGREYGDLSQSYGLDGGEYNVKLPFETMLFSNITTNFQVGYSVKTDLKPYIPKPLIIYDYGVLQTVGTYYIFIGLGYTTYTAFGSETSINSIDYSLNFGAEVSSLKGGVIFNSLYNQFYQNYLLNIYSVKARALKVSAILPSSFLTSSSSTVLKLNTKIIISGKRYIINSFNTNLITGVVDFDLINDFRDAV